MWSPETSFFSNFSTRKLVERNNPAAAASCDPTMGGGGVGGRVFNALKLDVERTLHNNGATITDRGSTGPSNFYFAYTLKDVRGRVELTGTRIGMEYYDVRADLNETRN